MLCQQQHVVYLGLTELYDRVYIGLLNVKRLNIDLVIFDSFGVLQQAVIRSQIQLVER